MIRFRVDSLLSENQETYFACFAQPGVDVTLNYKGPDVGVTTLGLFLNHNLIFPLAVMPDKQFNIRNLLIIFAIVSVRYYTL